MYMELKTILSNVYSLDQQRLHNKLKNQCYDIQKCKVRKQTTLVNVTPQISELNKKSMSEQIEFNLTSTINNIPQIQHENDPLLHDISFDISNDLSEENDGTLLNENSVKLSSRTSESSFHTFLSPENVTSLPRTNSSKSVSSADSYRSALPPNSLVTVDSSSYASVNDRSLSSYYTANEGGSSSTSSVAGYDTPTPQMEDDSESSIRSSASDLSHAETLAPDENTKSAGKTLHVEFVQ
ncbi:unnamed protein product [Didymodactylos carnosus]|uniref:Uncharacterized protein n=1 Tax=Didymodactylos carnosus TaxID=1234261 RepID=A0A8S2ETY5_9BILA|nr:unnamed protein product [Didymodactylos carnosus]CAF4078888.1 unnamed protein product [Didymodactylos carnosus]